MGVAPVTGIPLPFVTVGGSSMVANLVLIGVLQSIHARGELGRSGSLVSAAGIRALVNEARSVGATLARRARPASVGPIGVSGMLAEQLAKELGGGAAPGAVVVGGASSPTGRGARPHRRGRPDARRRASSCARRTRDGVPVVVVQLWPQADWTLPFVLSPFVVECRAGEGFPVAEIADRIVEATENGAGAGARAFRPCRGCDARPLGEERRRPLRAHRRSSESRLGVSRPLLTLEQVRVVSRPPDGARRARRSPTSCRSARAAAAAAARCGIRVPRACASLRTVVPAPIAARGRRGRGHVGDREGVRGRRDAPSKP